MASNSQAITTSRSYEDFQPSSNWVREEDVDTLVIHLPGFKKEHLRVQTDGRGNLKLSGECPIEGNRWSRFHKELRVPKTCNTDEITAKFTGGLLYVKLPKKFTDAIEQDQQKVTQDASADENAASEKKSEQGLASGSYSPGGLALRLNQHRRLVLGIVVTLSVAVALGIYGICRLRSSAAGEDGN